nr:hypothetical protein [Tanacetum cinerariifolium]
MIRTRESGQNGSIGQNGIQGKFFGEMRFTLDMQVRLHDKRIVMQVTFHYEAIVMQVTLHDKRIVMQVTLHYEAIVMLVTLHDNANSSAGETYQLSSGKSSSLAVAKYSNSGIFVTGSGKIEEGHDAEDDDDELYKDVNINMEDQDDLPKFGSLFGFNHHLKTIEANFSEFIQTNQFAGAVSSILEIVERYMDQWMNEAVKVAVQIQSDRLRDEAQAKNEKFLSNLDENIQKIIKEQVKEQIKTSYVMAADLSEMELKKILIEKIESNKSIQRYDELDRGSKRRREGKEPESTSAPKEKAPKTTGKSTQGSKSHQKTASESALEEEPMQTTQDLEEPLHQEFKIGDADDQPITEASQHPEDDDKLYKFKEGDFKRLRIQDIEDLLLLLAQGKLTNLTVEERFAFNVSLRMFTRNIVIQLSMG